VVIFDIVVDAKLARVLRRLTRIAPSIAMAGTEANYLGAMQRAGLSDAAVCDRRVYRADELLGLFADDVTREAAGAWPLFARPLRSRAARGVLRWVARPVADHVWSSKFHARKA
jgi:hypothetical protein